MALVATGRSNRGDRGLPKTGNRHVVVTLAYYAGIWVEDRNVKPRTRSMYRDLLRLHITRTLGRLPLKNVTPETVRVWFAALGTERVRRNSHAYGLLHAVRATAVSDGLLAVNPCNLSGVMNPPRKTSQVFNCQAAWLVRLDCRCAQALCSS